MTERGEDEKGGKESIVEEGMGECECFKSDIEKGRCTMKLREVELKGRNPEGNRSEKGDKDSGGKGEESGRRWSEDIGGTRGRIGKGGKRGIN